MAVRLDKAGHKLLGLALNSLQLARGMRGFLLGALCLLLPEGLEHGMGGEQQLLRGPHAIEQAVEVGFQHGLANVLAGHLAAFGEAPVIGIARTLAAARPRCCHGAVAAGAVDEAAQGEIIIQIGARGRDRLPPAEPVLNLEKRLVADKRLVLCRDAVHPPFRRAHISGIERLCQYLRYLLGMNAAEAVLGKDGVTLKEALYLGLRLKAPRGKAFQRLLDDTRNRLDGHKHLAAMPGDTVKAISHRRHPDPIAVRRPRHHAVLGLLGVLLALVLGNGGEQVLDQHAVGILTELDGRAFQLAAHGCNGGAELDMGLQTARKAADVIDDDDVARFAAVFF